MSTVLIVEDDQNKLRRICEVIEELDCSDVVIRKCGNALDAIRVLRSEAIDVLFLDLQIPRRDGELPHKSGGSDLLRKILRQDSSCSLPPYVLGVTSHRDLQSEHEELFKKEGWALVAYEQSQSDWEGAVESTVQRAVRSRSGKGGHRGVLLALHGIRTIASWHRTLADVAQEELWICPIHRWWYGQFSLFQLLSPFARSAKVHWFRERYAATVNEYSNQGMNTIPSVVAHSFGSYILGNALLKYREIRINKLVLCGAILPRDFPWGDLIENGQVQSVLNCVGEDDIWPVICSFIVPGTGSSGRDGFRCEHKLVKNESHNLAHSEFFDALHMKRMWFPYLNAGESIVAATTDTLVRRPSGDHPFLSFLISPVVFIGLLALFFCIIVGASKAIAYVFDCILLFVLC